MNKLLDIGIITNTTDQFLLGCNIIKECIINRHDQQHVIFHTNDLTGISTGFVPILPIVECKFFYGNLIVFDLQGLEIALNCMNTQTIVLYLKDNIWKNYSAQPYGFLRALFNHQKLKVCVSDEIQATDYYHCWGKQPDLICGEISYDKLAEIL